MKYCSDLPLKFNCCSSCHEDANEYGIELLDQVYKEEDYCLCCSAIAAIEDAPKNAIQVIY